MPRLTHKPGPGEGGEYLHPYELRIMLAPELHQFIVLEAARLNSRSGQRRTYTIQDVVRAILAAYQEKKIILGMQINPDD